MRGIPLPDMASGDMGSIAGIGSASLYLETSYYSVSGIITVTLNPGIEEVTCIYGMFYCGFKWNGRNQYYMAGLRAANDMYLQQKTFTPDSLSVAGSVSISNSNVNQSAGGSVGAVLIGNDGILYGNALAYSDEIDNSNTSYMVQYTNG